MCRAVFMWLLRKTVTPLEHNLLLVFTPEEIEVGDWLLFTIGKKRKIRHRVLKNMSQKCYFMSRLMH